MVLPLALTSLISETQLIFNDGIWERSGGGYFSAQPFYEHIHLIKIPPV